jgi:hypothetical protein
MEPDRRCGRCGDRREFAVRLHLSCVCLIVVGVTRTCVGEVVEDSRIGWACMIIRPYCVCDRHNATLQTLDLGLNEIGVVGAAAIGDGLRCVPTLRAIASLLMVLISMM